MSKMLIVRWLISGSGMRMSNRDETDGHVLVERDAAVNEDGKSGAN